MTTTSYEDEIITEIHLGIRLNRIENMIYSITKGLKEFESNSHTLLTSMGRMLGKRYHRYTIQNDNDLIKAKMDLEDFMDSQGWFFLDQITDLKQLHGLFNTFDSYNDQLFYNDYYRAVKGLTIARLVDFEAYSALKGAYEMRLILANYPESYRSSYNALTLFLENYSEN